MTDVAVVTGAAGGIGAATAKRLAADGLTVVVTDFAADRIDAVVGDIVAAGGRAEGQFLDVTDIDGWQQTMEVVKTLGQLKVLVNNAGILRDKTLAKTTPADWDAVIDTHLKGTFLGAQSAFPLMKDARGGAIVNVSSTASRGSFGQANYSAAKGGIKALTRTLAIEGARHGIRANAVAPGAVETPMVAGLDENIKAQFLADIPMSRFAEPSEIASVISFLSSEDASYLTGQIITIDGGATLGG